MHESWPNVDAQAPLTQILKAMTEGRLGMTGVTGEALLVGVITDGDLRRALAKAEQTGQNPLELTAAQIMSANPATIREDALALEAAGDMEARKITFLIAMRDGRPSGVIHIHDLLVSKVL